MRITEVRTIELQGPDLPNIADATLNFQNRDPTRALFVVIETDQGLTGLGMAATPAARRVVVDYLREAIIGQDPLETDRLWDEMFWRVRSFGRKGLAFCAISAVDIALWDLKGKTFGLPLYRLLGRVRDRVPVYGSGGFTDLSTDELVKEQVGWLERGLQRVKMKVAKDFGQAETEDLARLRAVREAVGDTTEIYVDANNGYYAKQATGMARRFEEFDVRWFEEPVLADDIPGLAKVARSTHIPIATGEHEYTRYGFRDLITHDAADILQPDVVRVGGITEWMKIAHLAQAFNLPVAPHNAQLVHLHLGCSTPNFLVLEYLATFEVGDRLWYREVPELADGYLAPLERPGLGLELDPDAVKRYAV